MSYLSSLNSCVDTLEQCNDNLSATTSSLASLCRTFPRVETVIRCERKYDLTTASDISRAQNLISKEAVPFLFRQVDQLETAIEVIRAAHESLGQRVEEQKIEYAQLMEDEASMSNLQKSVKAELALLSDVQANLLNVKSQVVAKERDLAELNRARSNVRQNSSILEEASKVDADIIRLRRKITEVEHETAAIPLDAQIQESADDNADRYLVLGYLREQLACCADLAVDDSVAAYIDRSLGTLELLKNNVFVPWWDKSTSTQTERMGYLARLLRYFFKDHGATMHAIIDILLELQTMTTDDLRRELSSTGHATTELPLLITHLKKIGAVTTTTSSTAAGKQVMTVQLDFSGLDGDDEGDDDYQMAEELTEAH
ncbi:hypothetical protein GGH91_000081 [Coemansia sp. RSA 2671]|nr:hypothetical protein LPJ60_000185 [Coemansia sp. RSA 2675]KAJ2350487.1 hypothetical protein GGH91_000081 [Coemansia sp. RSA 2671]KAJ2406120.1 hypothetical protein GGI10_005257 [Coemansia sp. RSA 2530]